MKMIIDSINLKLTDVNNKDIFNKILIAHTSKYDFVYKNQYDAKKLIQQFLISKQIEGFSPCTLRKYKQELSDFFNYINIPLLKITKDDIKQYVNYLQSTHIQNCTINTYLNGINSFFAWANQEKIINNYIHLPHIKAKTKPRKPLSELEIEQLRNACETLREKALFEFFYSTGCRMIEVVNVNIADVNFKDKSVMVLGKGKKYRTVYLNDKAIFALEQYLASRNDSHESLFITKFRQINRITDRTVSHMFNNLGKRAKINRTVHSHLLRHTTATVAVKRGMDITNVKTMLGHSLINTTVLYAKANSGQVQMEHQQLFR